MWEDIPDVGGYPRCGRISQMWEDIPDVGGYPTAYPSEPPLLENS